jgi:putative acetyltransferase
MYATSLAGSVHALYPAALAHPSITFVVSREHGETIGCGALKELDPRRGELGSVRAAQAGAGAAQAGQS